MGWFNHQLVQFEADVILMWGILPFLQVSTGKLVNAKDEGEERQGCSWCRKKYLHHVSLENSDFDPPKLTSFFQVRNLLASFVQGAPGWLFDRGDCTTYPITWGL